MHLSLFKKHGSIVAHTEEGKSIRFLVSLQSTYSVPSLYKQMCGNELPKVSGLVGFRKKNTLGYSKMTSHIILPDACQDVGCRGR